MWLIIIWHLFWQEIVWRWRSIIHFWRIISWHFQIVTQVHVYALSVFNNIIILCKFILLMNGALEQMLIWQIRFLLVIILMFVNLKRHVDWRDIVILFSFRAWFLYTMLSNCLGGLKHFKELRSCTEHIIFWWLLERRYRLQVLSCRLGEFKITVDEVSATRICILVFYIIVILWCTISFSQLMIKLLTLTLTRCLEILLVVICSLGDCLLAHLVRILPLFLIKTSQLSLHLIQLIFKVHYLPSIIKRLLKQLT